MMQLLSENKLFPVEVLTGDRLKKLSDAVKPEDLDPKPSREGSE